MKPSEFSCLIPFAGFYESIHSLHIDDVEERMFHDDSGSVLNHELYETFYSSVTYYLVYGNYARAYVDIISRILGVKFVFEEMVSPREYNFESDRIFAKISYDDFHKLFEQVKGDKLNNKIKKIFTSCSGFISHYSNDISEWPDMDNWDHNHCSAVIAAAFESEFDGDMEQTCWEEIPEGDIEHWLIGAATDEGKRALKIHDYLRRRQERNYLIPIPG